MFFIPMDLVLISWELVTAMICFGRILHQILVCFPHVLSPSFMTNILDSCFFLKRSSHLNSLRYNCFFCTLPKILMLLLLCSGEQIQQFTAENEHLRWGKSSFQIMFPRILFFYKCEWKVENIYCFILSPSLICSLCLYLFYVARFW